MRLILFTMLMCISGCAQDKFITKLRATTDTDLAGALAMAQNPVHPDPAAAQCYQSALELERLIPNDGAGVAVGIEVVRLSRYVGIACKDVQGGVNQFLLTLGIVK
jgi:hypothetical protein